MKNRESARNSRHRKKIYIELLEKKVCLFDQISLTHLLKFFQFYFIDLINLSKQ